MRLTEETVASICKFIWNQRSFAFNNVYEYLLDIELVIDPDDSSQSRLMLQSLAMDKYLKGENE